MPDDADKPAPQSGTFEQARWFSRVLERGENDKTKALAFINALLGVLPETPDLTEYPIMVGTLRLALAQAFAAGQASAFLSLIASSEGLCDAAPQPI